MAIPAYPRPWWAPRRWTAALARLVQKKEKHPFDRRYRVDTDGLIYADAAAQGHADARHNAGYYATAPSLFHGAIALWQQTLPGTGYALEDYALVDIGCGKGRVLMMAAEYAFREIVGVELDPTLARVARNNLTRVLRRRWLGLLPPRIRPKIRIDRVPQVRGPREQVHVRGVEGSRLRPERPSPRIRILEGDALTTPLPDGPVALFYFNSFEREMAQMWLARLVEIVRDRTHPLDLIYVHPEFDALVRQVPGMRVMLEAEIPFSEEDAAADVFGVFTDSCVMCRWNCSF